MPLHVGVAPYVESLGIYALNIDEETLLERFIVPYRRGESVTWEGKWIAPNQIHKISVFETMETLDDKDRDSRWPTFSVYGTKGENLTNRYVEGPPGYELARTAHASGTSGSPTEHLRDPRRVMIVHGRNSAALNAMRSFLGALGLEPVLWDDAVQATGTGSPHNLDAVEAAMALAQAVIVIFTAEDEARLIPELLGTHDGSDERQLRGQPRPNVLLEAGMALAIDRPHTILTRLGSFRGASDVDGLNAVGLGNGTGPRTALRRRLSNAGCAVNDRDDYLEPTVAGDFDGAIVTPSDSSSDDSAAQEGVEPGLAPELRVALNEISDELEYVQNKLREDDIGFWARYTLPVHRWQQHGSVVARYDDNAHAALRRGYYEIDRVQHCMDNQRVWVDGDRYLPEDASVDRCDAQKALSEIGVALAACPMR